MWTHREKCSRHTSVTPTRRTSARKSEADLEKAQADSGISKEAAPPGGHILSNRMKRRSRQKARPKPPKPTTSPAMAQGPPPAGLICANAQGRAKSIAPWSATHCLSITASRTSTSASVDQPSSSGHPSSSSGDVAEVTRQPPPYLHATAASPFMAVSSSGEIWECRKIAGSSRSVATGRQLQLYGFLGLA